MTGNTVAQRSAGRLPIATISRSALRFAGVAGVLAGLGLLAEFVLFGLTGMGQTTLEDPSTAIPFLREQGGTLRAAVLVGAANNLAVVLLYWGLAQRTRAHTPSLAAAGLLLGLVAVVADGLVAVSYWRAPAFVDLAADPAAAEPAWHAYQGAVSAARDVANIFVGFALVAFGTAGVWKRSMSRPLSALALLTGVVAVAGPIGIGAAYLASLVLAIGFRLWAGFELLRADAAAQPDDLV